MRNYVKMEFITRKKYIKVSALFKNFYLTSAVPVDITKVVGAISI